MSRRSDWHNLNHFTPPGGRRPRGGPTWDALRLMALLELDRRRMGDRTAEPER